MKELLFEYFFGHLTRKEVKRMKPSCAKPKPSGAKGKDKKK